MTGAPLTVTGVNVTLFYYTPTPATRITLLNAATTVDAAVLVEIQTST